MAQLAASACWAGWVRAHDAARPGQAAFRNVWRAPLRDAEVQDLGQTFFLVPYQEDVVGLQVRMNPTRTVEVRERLTELLSEARRLLEWYPPLWGIE